MELFRRTSHRAGLAGSRSTPAYKCVGASMERRMPEGSSAAASRTDAASVAPPAIIMGGRGRRRSGNTETHWFQFKQTVVIQLTAWDTYLLHQSKNAFLIH